MNAPHKEKRSSERKYRVIQGVGARHKETNIPSGGGRYLDNCTYSENSDFPSDPRMAELRLLKLPQMWIDMASKIGVDSFLEVWKMLDASTDDRALYIPAHSKYLKLQRDLTIQQLSREGHNGVEIKDILNKKMNIHIKKSQVYRTISLQSVGYA